MIDNTNKRSRPIKPLGDKNKKTNKEREKDKEVLFQCRSKKPSTSIPYEMKVKVLKLLDKNPDWSLKQLRQHSGCSKIQDHHQLRKWKDQVKKYEESKSSKSPKQREFIPLDMKIKIVNMAKKHPEWSIKTLQEKTGCPLIERRQQLNLWNEHIQAGGSQKERNQKIFKWIYEKCIEKKKQNNKTKITTNEIMEWSYEAHKLFFPNIPIKYKNRTNEKSSWVANFKRYYPDYQVSDDEESDELNKENNPDESTAVKKKKKRTSTYKLEPVSNEDKIKVIKLVNDNPNWSMEKIRQVSGCSKVYNRKQVLSWTKSIKHGSHFDKKNERDRLVYKKCKKYTENVKKKFSNDLLCQWGKEANKIIIPNDDNNLMFSIGEKWLTRFKGVYKIIGKSPNLQLSKESPGDKNKTTGTVSRKNNCSNDDTDGDDDDASNDISKIDSNVLADKVKRKPRYFASYDEKIKVLKTFKKHPGISLEELKKKTGCKYLYTINQLNRWVDHVKIGGSFTNKRTKICRSVYAKCIEYRDKNKKITYGLLRKWANEAYNKMPDDAKKNMKFCASTTWILNFKKNYGIFGLPTDLKIGDLPAGNNLNVNNNGGGEQSSDNVALIKSFKPAKPTCTRIPLDTAMKVLNLSYKHPNWDLKKLRKYSKCRKLVSFNQLLRWEKIIKNSKTFSKKCESMDRWILARCIEYKNKNYLITDKIIIGWALEAKRIFCNLSANHFATVPWLNNFKSKNKITGESSDLKIRN
ncbi:hypothetical protein HCN44_004384 [Aphidius gifuensis]|uniref:HTH CENPB-type domain-containing protein n=1 Tax=Aphidius gifuensis TaxID=684658 RepID=A0A834Y0L3_APHGI|nr:hypothetical protein HCN44_004384 [Aphidius gifuensis]